MGQDRMFAYDPLDLQPDSRQIRLLKVLPAPSITDDIRCMISDASLKPKEIPAYEALSYVWGSDENKVRISLSYVSEHDANGSRKPDVDNCRTASDQGLQHKVTQNLAAALRHIRLSDVERTMWIDAVCINQEDHDEKNHQVKQMRQIYLASQNVVLWLGEEGSSAIALDFLEQLPLRPNKEDWEVDYTFSHNDIPKWEACDQLFRKRPYWTRSWILQEILHHRDVIVYIGSKTYPIEELFRLFNRYYWTRMALSSIGNTIPKDEQSVMTENSKEALKYDAWFRSAGAAEAMPDLLVEMRPRFRHPPFEELRLGTMLYKFRDQKATNPKDKIYAFLGMVKDEYKIKIEYDDKRLPTRSLFVLTTRKLLARVLIVLLWIESPEREICAGLDGEKLPSWVPDFTHEQRVTPRCLHSTSFLFNADKDFPNGLKEVPSSTPETHGIFTIRGIYVGCITSTHRTNVTKKWSDDPAAKDWDQLKLFHYDRAPFLCRKPGTTNSDSSRTAESEKPEMTFENTSWGPCKAEIGDIIVVAAGSKIPLVLRKQGDGEYLFVGGCWLVDGQIEDLPELRLGGRWHRGEVKGFSEVMYGSAVEMIGKGCEIEEFDLY